MIGQEKRDNKSSKKTLKKTEEMTDMAENSLVIRLQEFIEHEARSCSMDFGCITPEYVYRMWGGSVALEDIEAGLKELRKK